jgi:hypothetical protein
MGQMAAGSAKNVVLIVILGAALLGAGVMVASRGGVGGGNPDFPDGHPYICGACGHVTVLSDDELFDLKVKARESGDLDAGRIVCSACGSTDMHPALKCPRCGKYFARPGSGWPVCPYCKQPFPSPASGE